MNLHDQTEIRLRVIDVRALARLAEVVMVLADHSDHENERDDASHVSDILWAISGRNIWDEGTERDYTSDQIASVKAEASRISKDMAERAKEQKAALEGLR